MKRIIPFRENERDILRLLSDILKKRNLSDELITIQRNERAMEDLASSISQYPSILGEQHLGKTTRSIETLVENLCVKDFNDILLHIPTKAILGKSFTIAKLNFFLMQHYLTKDVLKLERLTKEIQEIISENVFILMAEEVFLAIIADREISIHTRTNAAFLLTKIWENRIYAGVDEFAPILNNIWKAREKLEPTYGTMLGISELFRFSSNQAGQIWLDYLSRDDLGQDEIDALFEFLMGLSFEELNRVNSEMEKSGINALSVNVIDSILGTSKTYPMYMQDDPRELFSSFRHRKNNAIFRARGDISGPKKTLEEYLMCYLLAFPEHKMSPFRTD